MAEDTSIEPTVIEPTVDPKVEVKVEPKTESKIELKTESVPKPDDWRDGRISVLTAKLRAAQAEANAAKQKISGAVAAPIPEDEINRRAEVIAAEKSFAKECNDMIEAGKKTYGAEDFSSKITEFKRLISTDDPESTAQYWTLVRGALDTGEAPKVIYDLSQNLDEANRLMRLSPTKLGVELARLAAKAPPEPVSSAPKPISPVSQRSASHVKIDPDDGERADNLTTSEWMARRNAQVAERWEAKTGRKRA